MSDTAEKLKAVGFTPKVILLSLIVQCSWVYIFYLSMKSAINLHPGLSPMYIFLVEALIIKLLGPKYQLTRQELAVFFTIGLTGIIANTYYGGVWGGSEGGIVGAWICGFIRQISVMVAAVSIHEVPGGFPDLWLPKDPTALEDFRLGGASVPWGLWASTIFVLGTSTTLMMLMCYFFFLLFRRPWIETERLPFPQLVPTYYTLNAVKNEEEKGSLSFFNIAKNKVFWVPFILGCLVMIPEVLSQTMGVRLPNEIEPGAWGIILEPYLGQIFPEWSGEWGSLWFAVSWTGWCAAMSPIWFFVPMDILKSLILLTVVTFYILPLVICRTGLGTPGQWFLGGEGPGIPFGMFLGFNWDNYMAGPIYGCAAWLIFRYRKHIWHTVKSALLGAPREPGEPHSWRTIWLGFILCLLAWWGLMVGTGADPRIIVAIIPWLIIYLVHARVWAETGRFAGTMNHMMQLDFYQLAGFDTSQPNLALNCTWFMFDYFRFDALSHPGAHEISSLASFKIGDVTRTDPKSIGYAVILGTIVGVFFSLPLAIWANYNYGWTTLHGRTVEMMGIVEGDAEGYITWWTTGLTTEQMADFPNYHLWILAGAVWVFALFFLHSRFAWFWFNPIAIVLAPGCMPMLFLMILFFTLLKWLILRIGGARAYETIGVPAVSGFWMGIIFFESVLRIAIWITGAAEFMWA